VYAFRGLVPARGGAGDVGAGPWRSKLAPRQLESLIECPQDLQHADALDLTQQVMISIAKSIGQWGRNEHGTRFRNWLARVALNAILNALTRRPRDRAIGGSSAERRLREIESDEAETDLLVDRECRREVYLRAADRVKAEFPDESGRRSNTQSSRAHPWSWLQNN